MLKIPMADIVLRHWIMRVALLMLTLSLSVPLSGCVYWNTMYNAKKYFKDAEKQNNPEFGGTKMTANRRLYEDAIAKAAKIVQKHPKSKYHDDALFLIGVSYFRIDNYSKSESALRELLAVHPKSEFVEESQLYLARCRMQSGDEQAAYRTFSELASTARKPEWRAEATFQRGLYLSQIGNHDSAVVAFQYILSEYPNSSRANESRVLAADQLRELGRPAEAMALYEPLTTDKDVAVRYPALIGMGQACYEANMVDSGIAIFTTMSEDDVYLDSIGNIRLLLGDGLERQGDVDGAWRQYEQVAAALERSRWSAEAYFNMAEIKQYKQNDLASAKEFYDRVREEYASGPVSTEALTRSANISKLEQFRKSLGRGELSRGPAGDSAHAYNPEELPRLERALRSSPLEARPLDFVHSSMRQTPVDTTASLASDDVSSDQFGPEIPEEFRDPWEDSTRFGPITPTELRFAADTLVDSLTTSQASTMTAADTLAEVMFGPPTDTLALTLKARARELLSSRDWERLLGTDSLYGPPSLASLYDFGVGDVFGPETPQDLFYAHHMESPAIDSTVILEREERAALRKERESAFAEIETAAETQMQLAELYRFDLGYPDSALVEYNEIAERYKGTPYGAQALLAAADLYSFEVQDSAAAHDRLIRILNEYPYSDYAGDAIKRLGWHGTDADTAHPAVAYMAAEDRFLVYDDPKGAIKQFREFIDKYPYSRLVPRAEYAIVALTDRYFPSTDSSVIWAYQEISTAYTGSVWASAATERLSATVARPKPRSAPSPAKSDQQDKPGEGDEQSDSTEAEYAALPRAPRTKFAPAPIFPSGDVGSITEVQVIVYRITIDFSGNVGPDPELIQKSQSRDLDEATRVALLQTTFWAADSIPIDSLGPNIHYRYEMRVTPPAPDYDPNDPLNLFNRGNLPINQGNPTGQP